MLKNNNCRICGFHSATPPWGEDGKTPIFDYCPCCGVEHGYQDASPAGAKRFRGSWIESGSKWDDESMMPTNWNLDEQLSCIPDEYL